jgi:hypothetical protein
MTTLQQLDDEQVNAEVPVNENFETVSASGIFGKKHTTTSGLTWGYYGGRYNGNTVSDGTVTLTDAATNYIVVLRSTGVVSVSTATTNSTNPLYARLYNVTTVAGAVTAVVDERWEANGLLFNTSGSSGTVTSVAAGNGVETASGSAVTTTGTIRGAIEVNAQTGTTYTYVTGDRGKLVTHTNAAAIAGTLPQAGSAGFETKWYAWVQNRGAGTLTITPTTSTIDGAATLALTTGQGALIVSDGTNYFTMRGIGGSAGSVATDAIWDAAGDLAVGSGANTAAKLAIGAARQVLRVNGSANGLEWANNTESIQIACSDETTALTTGTAKVTFRMPYAFTLTDVRASVTTAPTGATLTVDINESGSTILSTKLTIDASEKTSTTAATPAVISDAALADDAEITIDIDQIGSTIAGAGLKVTLIGVRAA